MTDSLSKFRRENLCHFLTFTIALRNGKDLTWEMYINQNVNVSFYRRHPAKRLFYFRKWNAIPFWFQSPKKNSQPFSSQCLSSQRFFDLQSVRTTYDVLFIQTKNVCTKYLLYDGKCKECFKCINSMKIVQVDKQAFSLSSNTNWIESSIIRPLSNKTVTLQIMVGFHWN